MQQALEDLNIWRVIDMRNRSDAAIYLTHAQACVWVCEHPTLYCLIMRMPECGCAMPWQVALKQPPRISAELREELSPDVATWQRALDVPRPYGKRKAQKWGGVRK